MLYDKMQKYRILGKKGEGTFSEVLKIQNVRDGSYFACKKMKQHYDSLEQVNNLREVQAMRRLTPHPNVIDLKEVIYDRKSGHLALVCELMDMNLYEFIRGRRQYLPEEEVKSYMYQVCKSIDHMHRNGIFHRDVKPENILIKNDIVKLADFGSCRSVYSKQPYTEYISTRWYRAPECLLTDGYYSYKMDIWSLGCVFFEVLSLHPLFPGSNEVDQIAKIHDVLGTPPQNVLNKLTNKSRSINFQFPLKQGTGIRKLLPHVSMECVELIELMCAYDPDDRISARQILRNHYFKKQKDADRKAAAAEKDKNKLTDQQSKINTSTLNKHKTHRRTKKKLPHDDMQQKPSLLGEKHFLPRITGATRTNKTNTVKFTRTFPTIANIQPTDNTSKPQNVKTMFSHYTLPALEKHGGQ
ncbi:MAPK/MAK/MRK overlapping kinase-like isoform X2 [Xenia sp. Carnegie-2017]|uniref:MAPK/MAK/MRK overlapping kinase-like isoform X2 n=1 Tax=Xenia sp. Carnegie-2017 TaxID=2897299 RepID=UPI001F032EDE|nr:MAPK/MAK/MRK overlapping kinase-like isoform X2 [Xenia sp. Carnegie-2017]